MSETMNIKQIMKLALDGSPDPTLAFTVSGDIIFSNTAARNLFDEECEPGKTITDVASKLPEKDPLLSQFEKAAGKGRAFVTELMPLNTRRLYQRRFIPIMAQTQVVGVYLYLRAQEPAGSPEMDTTRSLDLLLETELEHSGRDPRDQRLALFMIQIRNFSELRALYGNDITETIMDHLNMTIRSSLRDNDLLFQIDGDRLLAMVTRYAWKSDLLIIAQRIEDQIAIPFHTRETVLHLLPSIGIAMFPDDGETKDLLLSNVQTALNRAVEQEVPYMMYNPELHDRAMERLMIRGDLNRAIREQELEIYYMPIVNDSREIIGLEALLRWNHPQRGLMTPDSFLPIAVHSRIIGNITKWVMYKVIQHQKNELSDFPVYSSFNISAQDLNDDFFLDSLKTAMGRDFDPARLRVELTENEIMSDFSVNAAKMQQLQKSGVGVMVDDFGTGHSSLTYLSELPASYLKVDRSFLKDVSHDEGSMEFLKIAIQLGHVRNKKVVLEGVETEELWDLLNQSGSDLFMGMALGEPLPLKDTIALLEKHFAKLPG